MEGYPDCYVRDPRRIGNNVCNDYLPYNSEQCGYDGGDCATSMQVEGYPKCYVTDPSEVGNGDRHGFPPQYFEGI